MAFGASPFQGGLFCSRICRMSESSVVIRPAVVADAPAIAQVHVATWQTTYRGIMPDAYLDALPATQGESRLRMWTSRLTRRPEKEVILAAYAGPQVIGFLSGGPSRDEPKACEGEVYAIYVLPPWQRKRVGTKLFVAGMAALKALGLPTVSLWVAKGNAAAAFYGKMGGVPDIEKMDFIGGASVPETRYLFLSFGDPK